MALGLILPSGGEIDLLGTPVRPDHAPLSRVGALVEEPAFWKYLSGRRNLEYFARAGAGSDRAGTRARLARVDKVLETVGLKGAADKRVKAYSQGMRQRLGLGLALLGQPELLVLDEPTNGLDPSGMREMRLLLRSLADAGTTIFVSSHLLSEVDAMCDRVGVMAQGRMLVQGPPSTLRGAADRIRVEVDDLALARATAAQLTGITLGEAPAVTTGPGSLRVTIADGVAPADLNAALVRAGVRVHALVPERDTLEDVFLHVVEGADVPR
jgi:ABC-2 type transport system ATP-binding protein